MEEAFDCVCDNCGEYTVIVRPDEYTYEEPEPSFCPFCAEPVDEIVVSEHVST